MHRQVNMLIAFLCVLQVLNFYWSYCILWLAMKYIKTGAQHNPKQENDESKKRD